MGEDARGWGGLHREGGLFVRVPHHWKDAGRVGGLDGGGPAAVQAPSGDSLHDHVYNRQVSCFGRKDCTQVSASALHLSLLLTDADETASLNSVWNINLQHYSAYSSKQLMPTVKKLASMLAKAENAKLQAVRSKYSSVKFMKVAVLPQLKGGMMTRLC